ncbi:Hypothetical predicted protein [Paramuricea clavata]|uniref:Uncharacterized protein n=1 Tax=Paramuricea clavata TaxID=317549 RepID=A0A7D9MAZ1_PARCT|nr:Hypothetical predicted protein [Paramuricea clavata]
MSGCFKGAQALIREKNPQAVFSPCSAHTLHLCGVHAAESNDVVKMFLGILKNCTIDLVPIHLAGKSCKTHAHISRHKLPVTRCSARIEAVKPLAKRRREILDALDSLREHDLPPDLCNDVDTLSKWFWNTIDEQLNLIKSLQNDLKRIREAWNVILEESKLVVGALGLTQQFQEKRRRIRKALYDEKRDNE